LGEEDILNLFSRFVKHSYDGCNMTYEALAYAVQGSPISIRRTIETGLKQESKEWATISLRRFANKWRMRARQNRAAKIIWRCYQGYRERMEAHEIFTLKSVFRHITE